MSRLFLLVLALGQFWCWAGPIRADDKPPATIGAKELEPQTDWYGVYLNGKKIGHCRMARDKVDDGIRESFDLVMKLVSFGQKAELSMSQNLVFETKAPYRMLRGDFVQSDGRVKVTIAIERDGDGFKITQVAGGVTQKKDHGPIDYTYLDSTASERWVRQAPKEGDSIATKDFSMQELKIEPQTNKVKSIKTSLVGGVPVKYYEIETESKQLTMLSRHDDQGRLLSGKFAVFDIRLEPEDQAKNSDFSADLFVLCMVKVDRPLGQTRDVRELVVEVAGLDGAKFDDGPRQAFFLPDDGNGPTLLKLGKKYGKQAKVSDKDIEENLKETLAYPISNAKIKALAAKAVGDAQTDEEKVQRIVDFVHDYVQPSLSATLPNIHDLIKRKKGDCKSYALMTTTLARAAGVPSREVSGLLYIGDDNKAFGGHAWNEVVLNGVWVPVDSSMREAEINATHVSFGPQDRAAKGLLETMGKLSFKLVEVQAGR